MTAYNEGVGRRFIKVSVVSGLSTALSVALQIISVPVCLRYWGKETYGQWLALFAAFTLMRTLDSGFIGYVGNKLNVFFHHDENALRETMASAVWGVVILGVLQFGVLALLYFTDSTEMILGADHHSTESTQAFFGLAILGISWVLTGSYLGVIHRLLIPTGMMYQAAWWAMALQVTQFSALMFAAISGASLLGAAVLFASSQAGVYLASGIYIRARLPRFYPWWQNPNLRTGFKDLLRSAPFTVSGILQQGAGSGMIVAVSSILGPVAVPAYTTLRTLSNLWTTLIGVLTTPLLPDIVRFHAKAETEKLIATQQAHWFLMAISVNLSIILAYPLLSTAYAVWTGHHLVLNRTLLCLLLAALPLTASSAMISLYLTGINRIDFVLFSAVARGGVALGLGILLMPRYGLAGLGIAILVTEVMVLTISLLHFFFRQLRRISRIAVVSYFGWHWLSTFAVCLYLTLQSAGLARGVGIYWIALLVVLGFTALSWQRLPFEIKARVANLVLSYTRRNRVDPMNH